MKQQGRRYSADQRRARLPWSQSDVGSDLLWEREMRVRRDKTGDVVGRPSWRSSFLGDPGAKFLCGKLAIGTKKEKRSKKKERPVGTVGGNKSSTGGTNSLEEQMPEGSRVSRFSRHLLGVPPPLMHCSLLRIPVPGVNRPSSDSLLRADGRVND